MTKPKHSSIIDNQERCFKTKKIGNLDVHHIMNGPHRSKSDKLGLWVYLDHEEHMWMHNTREGKQYERKLKQIAQKRFEELYSHEEWMKIFRRNYL